MAALPKKVEERIGAGLKRFQPILASAKARDVNESDTVVIITDLLQEIFGYDKYSEITSEHMIRGTFCDLAIKLDGHLALLIEAKAIGLDLKEQFVKQAVDYAANQGVEWWRSRMASSGAYTRSPSASQSSTISWSSLTSLASTPERPTTSSSWACSRRRAGRRRA